MERADLNADVADDGTITIKTANVAGFHIMIPDGARPAVRKVVVDGQTVEESDGCTFLALQKVDGKWARLSDLPEQAARTLRKQPTVCGPIDHAFMSRFVMVRPTGKPLNETVGAWASSEMNHATDFWRKVFRGTPP